MIYICLQKAPALLRDSFRMTEFPSFLKFEQMITKQKKSVRVGKYVNTGHVDTVIREYKKTRWVPNSERIGKPDSLSAWLSTEDMEDFLAATKTHGGDGVKFYFSVYPG